MTATMLLEKHTECHHTGIDERDVLACQSRCLVAILGLQAFALAADDVSNKRVSWQGDVSAVVPHYWTRGKWARFERGQVAIAAASFPGVAYTEDRSTICLGKV
eukprot:COSAG02_NODE_16873_length_1049_cov_1.017895_1_plen_103_part_10